MIYDMIFVVFLMACLFFYVFSRNFLSCFWKFNGGGNGIAGKFDEMLRAIWSLNVYFENGIFDSGDDRKLGEPTEKEMRR